MQATRDSVKYFLETPRRLLNSESVAEAIDKARSMRLAVTKTTAALTGMPSGSGADRSTKLAKYMDAVEDCKWAFELVEMAKENNARLIAHAALSDYQRDILTMKYVRNLTYGRVAKQKGISLRQMYRDVNAALDACAAYITLEKPSYAAECLTESFN